MKYNAIIIGGGAAGLSAALYLARAGLAPLIFAGSPPGGQLMLTSEVENFPGRESILGGELIDVMRKQAQKFGGIIVDENVKSVGLVGAGRDLPVQHTIESASGKIYQTKALIIATGAKALWMGLDSETRLRGKGVSACATCDAFFFKNKIVAVIGGGDSALEEALTLTKFASKVYIVHRRAEFKASKIMQKRVFEHEKIEIIWNSAIEEIIGEKKVEGMRIKAVGVGRDRPVQEIKLNGIFVAIGHRPDTDLFKGQIELDQKGYVLTTTMYALEKLKAESSKLKDMKFDVGYQTMTSVGGVFGAGDCVDHVYKQASTAAGMGVQAALDAERYLEKI
ncbi:thioredoxin-disulfide reductase [Candidatus Roizmanbacteria bacterium CG_4_10_14_3_um_filter_39_13]|uniref:Thioredoxin-disulfide reductase n=1 Tax=Candidatus Roizmanbacteria bacterium CG_4_10_14_3_um_filter_39_13 TaxID=1974831 RepID=A0A2M7LKC6_9BACT|nr:MAG: thioredoxin-disulfide reductase [Candidatus Roizmanbacteria bacterium CG_4_10_14_3_um_filter_39_13]